MMDVRVHLPNVIDRVLANSTSPANKESHGTVLSIPRSSKYQMGSV